MAKNMERDEFNRYLEESGGYERDLWNELRKSRKTAWLVAGLSAFVGVAGIGAGFAGLHQEAPPPTILRVDEATGAVDVVATISDAETSYGEVTDKYWLNQFMLHREGYDWYTIQADYDAIGLMAGSEVQAEYSRVYDSNTGRQVQLGNRARVRPKLVSITLGEPGEHLNTATIRFTTQVVRENGIREPVQPWIATLAYRYVNSKMSAAERLVNPLGLQVTSYRVDPEVIARGGQ